MQKKRLCQNIFRRYEEDIVGFHVVDGVAYRYLIEVFYAEYDLCGVMMVRLIAFFLCVVPYAQMGLRNEINDFLIVLHGSAYIVAYGLVIFHRRLYQNSDSVLLASESL